MNIFQFPGFFFKQNIVIVVEMIRDHKGSVQRDHVFLMTGSPCDVGRDACTAMPADRYFGYHDY